MSNCEEDVLSTCSYPSSVSKNTIDPMKAFNHRSYKRERDAPFFTDYLQSDDSHFDSDNKINRVIGNKYKEQYFSMFSKNPIHISPNHLLKNINDKNNYF